jgi:hypothetical protein
LALRRCRHVRFLPPPSFHANTPPPIMKTRAIAVAGDGDDLPLDGQRGDVGDDEDVPHPRREGV